MAPAKPVEQYEDSSCQHAAHEGAPGDWPDDAVDVDANRLLEPAHRLLGSRAENPVDAKPPAGITGEIPELELLLHPPHSIACAPSANRHYEHWPCARPGDTVDAKPLALLERFHARLRACAEDAIDR